MVVDILIYIEGCKDVKCMTEVCLLRNGHITPEDREEVCGMNYGVNVDNGHHPISIGIEIGFNNPHAIVRVGVTEGFAEVVDKCT